MDMTLSKILRYSVLGVEITMDKPQQTKDFNLGVSPCDFEFGISHSCSFIIRLITSSIDTISFSVGYQQ